MSAAAPSPSPRRRQHDAALDEVARAFGEAPGAPPGPSTSEMTARLPVAPAASVATASAARPVNVVTERDEEPAPPPRQVLSYRPLNAPRAEREPRRSRALPIVLVLLLLLVGAAAVLYFFYPALLPEWARPPGSSAVATRPSTSSPGTAPASAAAAPAAGPATAPAAAPASSADTSAATSPVAASSPALLPTAAVAAPSASAPAVRPPPVASAPPVAAAPLPAPAAPLPRAVAPSAPGAHFTAIEEIWGQRTGAGTVVTIVGNGPVPPDAFSHFRLEGDNPREVVRVRGVDGSFKRTLIAVGTTEVKEIRVGFHGQGGQGELHVVLDLASPRVKLVRLSATDNRIEIQLAQ